MKIKVKYTAQLKKAIGKGEELVDVKEGVVVSDLLNILYQQYREAFTNIVYDNNGEFMDAILLIRNGKQITHKSSEIFKENDVFTLMAPIAGG